MSLINAHSLDPATLYEVEELETATERYLHVRPQPLAGEDPPAYQARLLQVKPSPSLTLTLPSGSFLSQPVSDLQASVIIILSPSAETDGRSALGTEYPPQEEITEGKGPDEGLVAQLPQEQLQHQ